MKLTICCYSPLNWLAFNDGPSILNWVIIICSKVKPIQKYASWVYVAFLQATTHFQRKNSGWFYYHL
jgi:hypothetical protein